MWRSEEGIQGSGNNRRVGKGIRRQMPAVGEIGREASMEQWKEMEPFPVGTAGRSGVVVVGGWW